MSLQVTARFQINDGMLSDFKAVAARCLESVNTKDTGTLQYDWFLNEEGSECVVREHYRDSDAVFEHITNLGDTLGELLATADMALELYGTPNEALAGALGEMGAKVYAPMSV